MRRGDAPWAGRQQHCRPREKSLCAASDGPRSNRQSLAPLAPVAAAVRLLREGGPFSAHASKTALRKTMQLWQGRALPRKLLPSPPPWTGNSSIIFGSNSNVVFRPADALNGRDGIPESAAIEALPSNAAAGRGSDCHWTVRLGNGTDHAVLVCSSRQLSGRGRIWMTFPVAVTATCRGTSAAPDPNCYQRRRLPIPMATPPSSSLPGETIAVLDMHGRWRRGPMPRWPSHKHSRTRHIVE
jgi:hypothetical protein